jgi:hypothetical protein
MSKRNVFENFSGERQLQEKTSEELAQVLLRLDEFASWVSVGGFEKGLRKLVPVDPSEGVLAVSEAAARSLARDLTVLDQDILLKSLQETFVYIAEGDPDLTAEEFAFLLQRFAKRLGSRGLIRLFLSCYAFNFTWLQSADSFTAGADSALDLKKSSQAVENRCQAAVDAALETCDKWLGQNQSSAAAMVRSMISRLARTKSTDF